MIKEIDTPIIFLETSLYLNLHKIIKEVEAQPLFLE